MGIISSASGSSCTVIKMSSEEKSFPKTSINCLITIYLRTSANPYFIRDYKKFDNAYFI